MNLFGAMIYDCEESCSGSDNSDLEVIIAIDESFYFFRIHPMVKEAATQAASKTNQEEDSDGPDEEEISIDSESFEDYPEED